MTESNTQAAAVFNVLRPRLTRIAYRMLGSVADAEDIMQEAFIRWQATDRETVRVPEAFFSRVVTRLCLDQLKSARVRRETYVGPWLPEPLVETEDDEADDVTLPLMMALERLSPWSAPHSCCTTSSTFPSLRLPKRSDATKRRVANWRNGRATT